MAQYSKTEDGKMCKCVGPEPKIYKSLNELQSRVDTLKNDLQEAQADLEWAKANGVKEDFKIADLF